MTLLILVILAIVIIILNIILIFLNNDKYKNYVCIIDVVIVIISLVITIGTVSIQKPNVFPLDGMLTEDYPAIEIKSDLCTSIYYSDDPHVIPADEGVRYKDKLIPESSGIYYIQSKFLWNRSEILVYPFITYQDSLNKLGVQDDNTMIQSPDFTNSSVSQEMSEDINSLPVGLSSGWGDNAGGRSGFTIEEINEGKLYNQIIFNTITDGIIGDERNFVGAREETDKISLWNANLIKVEIGKNYYIRIYGHNNSPKGYDRIAEDVKIQYQIPKQSGKSIVVYGLISSSNAQPSLYWDGVVLTCDKPFHLEYVKAEYINNDIGIDGIALDDSVINNWVTIGYNQFDGRIPGCYQYSFYSLLCVKVVEDKN